MSKRISSDSRRTKAAPHSTVHSQVVMMTSSDQPTGSVQHVAYENLDDERREHHAEQRDCDILGAALKPMPQPASISNASDWNRAGGNGRFKLDEPAEPPDVLDASATT